MAKNKIVPKEGDVVAVPLQQGGFGIGLVARKYKSILLGYFFKCIFPLVPTEIQTDNVDIRVVALIGKFNSGGIENGEWPVLKTDFKFNKAEWPIPMFKMQHPITEKFYAVQYDDTLLSEERYLITRKEADNLFSYGLHGYGAIEKELSRILKENDA